MSVFEKIKFETEADENTHTYQTLEREKERKRTSMYVAGKKRKEEKAGVCKISVQTLDHNSLKNVILILFLACFFFT